MYIARTEYVSGEKFGFVTTMGGPQPYDVWICSLCRATVFDDPHTTIERGLHASYHRGALPSSGVQPCHPEVQRLTWDIQALTRQLAELRELVTIMATAQGRLDLQQLMDMLDVQ